MVFLPSFLTVFLMTFIASNFLFQSFVFLMPHIAMISVFFWAIFYPRVIPIWFAFLLGLLEDSLFGQHFGVQSFLLVIEWYFLVSYRKYLARQAFPTIWLLFLLIITIYELSAWLLYCIIKGTLYFDESIAIYVAVNALTYPIFHNIFMKIHMRLIKYIRVRT
jgi:rod shape-determining protein MreD